MATPNKGRLRLATIHQIRRCPSTDETADGMPYSLEYYSLLNQEKSKFFSNSASLREAFLKSCSLEKEMKLVLVGASLKELQNCSLSWPSHGSEDDDATESIGCVTGCDTPVYNRLTTYSKHQKGCYQKPQSF